MVWAVLVLAILISGRESRAQGPFCPESWIQLRVNSSQAGCLSPLSQLKVTRDAAVAECRKNGAVLVNVGQYVNRSSFYSDIRDLYPFQGEFWTGFTTYEGFSLLDAIPPATVTPDNFQETPLRHWTWASGQPSSHQCQVANGSGTGQVALSMVDCSNMFQYHCLMPSKGMSQELWCPEGFIGHASLDNCFFVKMERANYTTAEKRCQEQNAALSNVSRAIMFGLYDYFGRVSEVGYFSAFVGFGNTLPDFNTSRPQRSVSCPMADPEGYLRYVSCLDTNYYVCQRPREFNDKSIVLRLETDYSNSSKAITYKLYEPTPISCVLSRLLIPEVESLELFRDGNPVPLTVRTPFNVTNTTTGLYFTTMVPRAPNSIFGNFGEDLVTGEYWCAVYSVFSVIPVQSGTHLIRFPKENFRYYRGSLGVRISEFPNYQATLVIRNMGLEDNNNPFLMEYFGAVRNRFANVAFEVSMYFQEDEPVRNFLDFKEEVKKYSLDGKMVEFSFALQMSENAQGWLTMENDLLVLQLLREKILKMIIGDQLEGARSKRQIGSLVQSNRVKRQNEQNNNSPFVPGTLTLRSTSTCAKFEFYDSSLGMDITLNPAVAGTESNSTGTCITDRNPLAKAYCQPDFKNGAYFNNMIINTKCVFEKDSISRHTEILKNLSQTSINETSIGFIVNNMVNLTSAADLNSLDVVYVAEILRNIEDFSDIDSEIIDEVTQIVDNIANLDGDILADSQRKGSATTRIVESLENISKKVKLTDVNFRRVIFPSVLTEVRDLNAGSDLVVGIELEEGSVILQEKNIKTLSSENDLVNEQIQAAIVLPRSVLAGFNDTRLTMQIYLDGKLFTENSPIVKYRVNSRVVAASIIRNGTDITRLGDQNVKTIFKPFQDNDKPICAFWDYDLNAQTGGWSTEGCRLQEEDEGRVVCVCNHLTNFAVLMNFEGQVNPDDSHQQALTIITIIGLSLSIIGLSLTVISFVLFKSLRVGRGQKTLFGLALSMLCSWIVFMAGIKQTQNRIGCIAVAVILHYLILVTFMWILVEALLQYLRFVKVLGTYVPRFILKASLAAFGVPLIPVIVVLAIDVDLYKGGDYYCWMSKMPFFFAFAIPIGLIILINTVVFVLVLTNILHTPKGLQSTQSEKKRNINNFWAGLCVFVLLGITWIFGFFAINDARILFQYLFTICNTLQGFFIFLLFTFRDKQVRQQWLTKCCAKHTDKKKDTYMVVSSSNQDHSSKTKSTSDDSDAINGNTKTGVYF